MKINNKLNIFIILITLFSLILVNSIPLSAQESDDDSVFDEGTFDQTVTQGIQNSSQLQVLFGGTLQFSSVFDFPLEFDTYYNVWSISGIGFLSIVYDPYAKFFVSESFSHSLALFSDTTIDLDQNNQYSIADLNDSFDLLEIFFDISINNILFIRVGKQVIHWGAATVWNPSDFINLNKYNPLESLDSREGKNGVRIHLPIKKFNLFVFFDFYNTAPTNQHQITDFLSATSLGIRADYTIKDFEIAFTTYLTKDQHAKFGFDFSGYLLGFGISGEAAFSASGYFEKVVDYTLDGQTLKPTFSYTDEPVFSFTIGLSKIFGDKKDYFLELDFFYNSDGYELDDTIKSENIYYLAVLSQKSGFLYNGKFYGFLRLNKSNFINSYMSLTFTFIMNFTDYTYRAILSHSFSLPNILPFSYSIAYVGGEENREFTIYGAEKFSLTISTSISF